MANLCKAPSYYNTASHLFISLRWVVIQKFIINGNSILKAWVTVWRFEVGHNVCTGIPTCSREKISVVIACIRMDEQSAALALKRKIIERLALLAYPQNQKLTRFAN